MLKEMPKMPIADVVVSILLPFVSHMVRQSVACSDKHYEPQVFMIFLISYAISMLAHTSWIDVYTQYGMYVALALFCITFGACLYTSFTTGPSWRTWFTVTWALHAMASSALWPLSYRLVNGKRRSRTFLAIWGLQGNMGDLCGCALPLFNRQPLFNVAIPTFALVSVGSLLVCISRVQKVSPPEGVDQHALALLAADAPRRSHVPLMASSIVASACAKTVSYSASNFMPALHIHYPLYGVGTMVGAISAGGVADVFHSLSPLAASALLLLTMTITGEYAPLVWHLTWFSILFGATSAFVSSMLSICVCTDIADHTRSYGKTTAIFDSCATLVAAFAQLIAPREFSTLQLSASGLLCVATLMMQIIQYGQDRTSISIPS